MIRKKSATITKAHLDASEQRIRASFRDFAQQVTRSFGHVNQQFTKIDEQFQQVNLRLDAIMEMMLTRKEMLNLFRELDAKGIHLDHKKILFQ